jgi:hypothetical protein
MREQSAERTRRTTSKEKLKPTPHQEHQRETVLCRCRTLDNTALTQRITAWERGQVSVARSEQEAEQKAIRAGFLDSAAIHSHVLQAVLARLDTTSHVSFRHLANGEQPGYPRVQGRTRWHSCTDNE